MFNIRFQLNLAEHIRAWKAVEGTVTNFTPLWPDVAEAVREIWRLQFATEGAHSGARWVALTHPYAERKKIEWPGKTILKASEAMFESFTQPGAAGAIYAATPRDLTMGSALDRASWHDQGTDRMAARKIINLVAKDEDRIIKTMEANLARAHRILGFETVVA